MNIILIVAALVLYTLSALLLAARLRRGSAAATTPKSPALAAGLAGAALHAIILYGDLVVPGGINLAFFNAVSLIAWLVVGIVLLAALARPVENLAIVVAPLAALGLLSQELLASAPIRITGERPALDAHVVLSIFAYSMLMVAAVQSLVLAVQDHHLRNRQPGGFIRALPPLETMEGLLFRMIGIGYVLLSAALITGALFIDDIFAQHLVHKTVLSIAAWCVFGILLWGRRRFGWRGRKAIRWTLGGFLALVLAYFGSKFVLELILGT